MFSRVFYSKDPSFEGKQALDVQRTWYMQKIWGCIAYNPNVADDLFKNHLASHFPEAAPGDLFEAWSKASRALRLINEQVTAKGDLDGTRSVLANADELEKLADEAGKRLATIKAGSNHELSLNLNGLDAMMCLALFGAAKIRAAISLEQKKLLEACEHLLSDCGHWTKYADIMDAHYIGADMQRNFRFKTWHQLDADILRELADLGGPMIVETANPHPWVRIVSPLNLAETKAPADVTVTINAAAANQKPVKVERRDNGQLINTFAEATFIHALPLFTALRKRSFRLPPS